MMKKIDAIIIDGKAYEVVSSPLSGCDKCGLKKECDQILKFHCLADELFGVDGVPSFRFSQELTDKINKL